jgi:excisionase family DNA binding protein
MPNKTTLLTTQQAAESLGVSQRRVRALIASGRLRAHQVGRTWVIRPSSVAALRRMGRRPGRPPKTG